MRDKEKILQFSGLPNLRYPNNIVDADKKIFDYYLNQKIPHMEVKTLNNVLISPYGIIYKKFSILKECTPYYFDMEHDYVPQFMKNHINGGGILGGSIERFIRHFIAFKKTNIKETHFWCSDQYSHGYFHWLCETLPRIYLLTLLGFENPSVILPGPTTKNVNFIRESLNLLFPDINFSFTQNRNVLKLRELIWISQMGKPYQFNPLLINSFRQFVRGLIKAYPDSPKKRLYISRKNAIRRKVSNEDKVEKLLEGFGFETVYPENYNFAEQIERFAQSEIIIGIHGAGLSNMIFLPDNSFVLELQRPMPAATCFYNLANSLNLNYYYLFCNHNSEEVDGRLDHVDLHINLNALENLVENIVSTCEAKKNLQTEKPKK
jgi:hypothetical protein